MSRAGLVRRNRGMWVPAESAESLETRCAAALRLLPPGSAISHRTAALLRGLPVPDLVPAPKPEDEIIHVTVPGAADPRIKRLRVHRLSQPFRVESLRTDIAVTTSTRIWLDLAAELGRDDHVILGDNILNRDLSTPELLAAILDANVGRRGVAVARTRLLLLDGRADSPMETRVRLLLVDNRIVGFVVNEVVYDSFGERLGKPDIAFIPPKFAVQYEGAHHREPDQFADDIRRDDCMREEGWFVLRLVSWDIFGRPMETVHRIRHELALRGFPCA